VERETAQTVVAKDPAPAETPDNPDAKPAAKPAAKRDEGDRNRGRGGRRDRQVVGMGDHVPAFLMRPTRPAKATDIADTSGGAESETETEPQPENAAA